jgi:hypothetical protein
MGDLGVDRRIILKYIWKETGCEGVKWIHLGENKELQAPVNTSTKRRVS